MKEFYIDCDGVKLHAKLDRPEGAEKSPLCILIHGFTGHMEEDHIIAAQRAMNEAGAAVLRVEMYGHGGSGGKFGDHTLYKWVTNALAVVEYARTRTDFDPAHIPERLSSERWELKGDYIRVAQTIHVEDEIARFGGRVFIVHGDADETVPFLYAEKAVKLYRHAELVPVHGADHCFVGHLDELAGAVKGFFAGEMSRPIS